MLFRKAVRAWANDFHACPVEDAKVHLRPEGVRFYDYSLSGAWRLFHRRDPARRLKVLSRGNMTGPYEFENYERLARQFSAQYGAWMRRRLDFLYCSFLPTLCHVFAYCARPILLHASFRFEGNCATAPDQARKLLGVFARLRDERRLVFAATNRYDAAYLQYFTGIEPAYLAATAPYVGRVRYAPARPEILIGPSRFSEGGTRVVAEMKEWFAAHRPSVMLKTIRELYPQGHTWAGVARHPAIVVMPYSVHAFAITEYKAMGIPLFFPSRRFLVELHLAHYLLHERKADPRPARGSQVQAHAAAATRHDPNHDFDRVALEYWLGLCDWYGWPVEYFDSWQELAEKLERTDLSAYHARLQAFNRAQEETVSATWRGVLKEVLTLKERAC